MKNGKVQPIRDAFDLKNGNAAVTVSNWLKLLGSPLVIVLIVVLVLFWASVRKSAKVIQELPETTAQVERNTESIECLEGMVRDNHDDLIFIKAKLID